MKKVIITSLFSILMALPILTIAQTDAADASTSKTNNNTVREPGTIDDPNQDMMRQHILDNTKYPASAKQAGVEGRAFVGFKVAPDGSIVDVKLVQGSNNDALDTEALRVIKTMPKWTPIIIEGKASEVAFTIPVSFKL